MSLQLLELSRRRPTSNALLILFPMVTNGLAQHHKAIVDISVNLPVEQSAVRRATVDVVLGDESRSLPPDEWEALDYFY